MTSDPERCGHSDSMPGALDLSPREMNEVEPSESGYSKRTVGDRGPGELLSVAFDEPESTSCRTTDRNRILKSKASFGESLVEPNARNEGTCL